MTIQTVLAELRGERDRISQAIAALESIGGSTSQATGQGQTNTSGKRIVSALARRRMARAQRARWAKVKSAPKLTPVKRTMSPEAIEKIRRAKKKWWKAKKKGA